MTKPWSLRARLFVAASPFAIAIAIAIACACATHRQPEPRAGDIGETGGVIVATGVINV